MDIIPRTKGRISQLLTNPVRLVAVVTLVSVGLVVGAPDAGAVSGPLFEVDASTATPTKTAMYDNSTADDWVNDSATAGKGMFQLSPENAATGTAATDCYGANIDEGPADGYKSFICDGNSDSKFRTIEPERSIVSPSGKTVDDVWPIQPGNNTAKNDFSHGYTVFRQGDSICDTDTTADNMFLIAGGHRGDNEGDAFWGFEFNKTPPTGFSDLLNQTNGAYTLDFNRNVGDVLVSYALAGGGNPTVEVFTWDGTTFVPATAGAGCPDGPPPAEEPSMPQGDTLAQTNTTADISAPPWPVPACDPTADNKANTCRLASSTASSKLLPPRDFIEGVVDMKAFGITNPCFTSVVFTSRSSTSLTADLKDVAGSTVPLCGADISVAADGVNEVGTAHTFTATVTRDVGGVSSPISGALVNWTITDDHATVDPSVTPSNGQCTTGAAGTCSIQVNSTVPMVITANAASSVNFLGASFNVSTGTGDGQNPPAIKRYVDANVAITPLTAINEVGSNHIFTITSQVWASGAGAPASWTITPALTTSVASTGYSTSTTCGTPTKNTTSTPMTATCTYTVNSTVPGTFTLDATTVATWTGGPTVTRDTLASTASISAGPNGSGSAVKDFVDLSVAITPTGTNGIGETHAFTVNVTAYPAGVTTVSTATVTATAVNAVAGGTAPTIVSNTCSSALTLASNAASCVLTINSTTANVYNANANVSVTYGTGPGAVTVSRSTSGNSGPGGSGQAVKTYVDGTIRWLKHDDQGNLLAGATFEVCKTKAWNSDTSVYDTLSSPYTCVSVLDDNAPDADTTGGEFELRNLGLGEYRITETAAPTGWKKSTAVQYVSVNTTTTSASAANPFVNTPLYKVIVIVCKESDNSLYSGGRATLAGGTEAADLATVGSVGTGVSNPCDLGGAVFRNRDKSTSGYAGTVKIL